MLVASLNLSVLTPVVCCCVCVCVGGAFIQLFCFMFSFYILVFALINKQRCVQPMRSMGLIMTMV